jgi:endonuclease I
MKKRILTLILLILAVVLAWADYSVTFEGTGETKTAYASGTVSLSGTNWDMTEALIGDLSTDWKNGLRSARMRGYGISAMTMLADKVNGLGTLSFSYRRYGTDTQVDWKAEYSSDGGSSWTQIGSVFTAPASDVVQSFSQAVNVSGAVRIRIKRATESGAANARLNIDDITMTDYAGLGLPVLTTTVPYSITTSSAISGGNISSDGGASVTARGVCYATTASPTLSNSHTSDGSGTGTFTSNLSSLSAETQYYVRAYATNSQGTAYGEEYSFSTSGNSPPTAPTATAATSITVNSFTANWTAVSGATSYRLDVSTNSSFSSFVGSYNNYVVSGITQSVSGLSAGTGYFYRVRAYNANGTSGNSNTISLSTLASDPFNGYYNPVNGLTGTALKTALHNLIDNNTYSSYDGAKLFLFQDLDNNNGVVRCVYTGQDYTVSSSYDGSSNPNTEHTYAQSWFTTSEESIKKADVHHLFVSNSSVNSSRGNLPFDIVTNVGTTYPSYNGYVSKRGTNSSGDTVFEPADQHKGNLARALLYFNVRYDQTLSQGGVDMLETLLLWHNADPVDAAELARNTLVYGHQGNRNPFVDHPEYVSYIWGGSSPNTTIQFSPASASVNENGGSVTLSVEIQNPSSTAATTAQIALTDGTAADVNNYSTRSITFPAGSSVIQSITVNITDDTILEGIENLVFSLINVSGGTSATVGNYNNFNLEIIDNDVPTPVATTATGLGFTEFTANWNAAPGITDYEFDLSTSATFSSFVGSYENYPVTGTTLAISGLTQGTPYFYRVKAVFNECPGAYSNVISVTTNQIVYLDTPVASDATAVSHEGFTARWQPVTGAESYRLDVFSGQTALATDLILSEYVEGSSNNKYLEIFNGTGSTIDLSTYKIKLYANGATAATNTQTLTGTLPNNTCMVLRNSSAVLTLPEGVTATISSATNFNGNDAIAIVKGDPEQYVDIFGRIGDASYWASGDISATNQTLRRKGTVLSGISSNPTSGFPTLVTEWDTYAIDTVSGLGSHSIGASSPLAGYQDLIISTNAARVSGLEPFTEYSYRVRAVNSGDTSDNSNLITLSTTPETAGSGANTSILGAATTILVPPVSGFSNTNLSLDPAGSNTVDFSLTESSGANSFSYLLTTEELTACNGQYVLNHTGLGWTPVSVTITQGVSQYIAQTTSFGLNSSQFSLSGVSGSGTLSITLNRFPDSLSSPQVTIALNAGNIRLSWTAISNATSYRIEASDTPEGSFTSLGTTTSTSYDTSSSTHKFYRVTALN